MSFLKMALCAHALSGLLPECSNRESHEMNRITGVFLKVLNLFLENAGTQYCGADIMKKLRLPSGTVYPLLTRMAAAGWLKRELEDVDPSKAGRPAKRFYQISAVGLKEGRKLMEDYMPGVSEEGASGEPLTHESREGVRCAFVDSV